jgi:hypothetical protein
LTYESSTDLQIDINIVDSWNNTPLHYACFGNYIDCINCLIESNADINIPNEYNQTSNDLISMLDLDDVAAVNIKADDVNSKQYLKSKNKQLRYVDENLRLKYKSNKQNKVRSQINVETSSSSSDFNINNTKTSSGYRNTKKMRNKNKNKDISSKKYINTDSSNKSVQQLLHNKLKGGLRNRKHNSKSTITTKMNRFNRYNKDTSDDDSDEDSDITRSIKLFEKEENDIELIIGNIWMFFISVFRFIGQIFFYGLKCFHKLSSEYLIDYHNLKQNKNRKENHIYEYDYNKITIPPDDVQIAVAISKFENKKQYSKL